MKLARFTAILLAVFTIIAPTYGDTLSFDTTFNGTGFNLQAAAPAPAYSTSKSMAVQTDGKIVVGGHTVLNQAPEEFALVRFNADGTLDSSFGTNGVVTTHVGFQDFEGKVLIQPDGKILLAGNATVNDAATEIALIRYNTDGSLDTSFNSTGIVTRGAPGVAFDDFYDVYLHSDGKIVVAGRTAQVPGSPNLEYNAIVFRFNPNGSPDTSFNGTGMLISGENGVVEAFHAVVVRPDGKILLGGLRQTNSSQFTLTLLNSDGTIAPEFGSGGKVTGTFGSSINVISTIGIQTDGKILAGGGGYIARFSTSGVLDPFFGINGVVGAPTNEGKIKVLGNDDFYVSADFAVNVSRYLKDGVSDTTFGGFLQVANHTCSLPSIDVQANGKILLGGRCRPTSDNIYRFAAFRLNVNSTYNGRFLDFDGDGTTNISHFRPSTGQWLTLNNSFSQTSATQFGTATDRLVPADFTGDGRTDIAIFRPSTGEWFILRSMQGSFYSFQFGTAGDIPFADDFDGDQKADAAVFRPSTNQWFIQKSTGGYIYETFGTAGDKIVPADYDGDDKTDIAIYRPSGGEWWIRKSSDGSVYAFQFGTSTDKPVHGDYTGDNKTDAAFWRPSTGEWFILRSEDSSYYAIPFGLSSDLPTPGNYSGDGRFDLAVYRPSEGRWHIQPTGGAYFYKDFGIAGDQPVANVFVP